MGTWRVVGTSWQQTWKGLGVVGVITGLYLLIGLLALPFAGQENPQELGVAQILVGIVAMVVSLLLWPLVQAGCLSVANVTLSQGQGPSALGSFWEGGRRLYWRMLGFGVLMAVCSVLFVVVSVLVFALAFWPASANLPTALSIVLALLAAGVVAIGFYLLMLGWGMGPVAMTVERLGVFAAIKRGVTIGRAAITKLLLVTLALLLTVVPLFLVLGFGTALPLLLSGQGNALLTGTAGKLGNVVLQSVGSGLSMVLYSFAYVQIYRHRLEVASATPSS